MLLRCMKSDRGNLKCGATGFRSDGQLEIDNKGGEPATKLNGLDPELYLHQGLERIADQPISQITELLP